MFSLTEEIAAAANRSTYFSNKSDMSYSDGSEALDDTTCLLGEGYRDFLALAQGFDSSKPDSILLCSAIKVVMENSADNIRGASSSGNVPSDEIEIVKKTLRILHFMLLHLVEEVKNHGHIPIPGQANVRTKNLEILKLPVVQTTFECTSSLLNGVRKVIELGFRPFGNDEDEFQAIADQYIAPVLSLFDLPLVQYNKRFPNDLFNILRLSHQYHSQTQQIIERLVWFMKYSNIAVELGVKFVRRLIDQDQFHFAAKISEAFLNIELDPKDPDYANQTVNLSLFVRLIAADELARKLLSTQYKLVLSLLEGPDPKIRSAAANAIETILQVYLEDAGTHDGLSCEESADEAVPRILKKCYEQTLDSSYLVRQAIIKMLSAFYKTHHAWFNKHSTQDLLNGLIEVAKERMSDIVSMVRAASMELFGEIMLRNIFLESPSVPERLKLEPKKGQLNSDLFKEYHSTCEQVASELEAEIADASDEAALNDLLNEKAELELNMTWYFDGIKFTESVDEAINWATKLLFSARNTDLAATIMLLERANILHVKTAQQGIIKMLDLVWLKPIVEGKGDKSQQEVESTKEKDKITDLLLQSYGNMWFNQTPDEEDEDDTRICMAVATRLVSVVSKLTVSQLTSFERLLQLYTAGHPRAANGTKQWTGVVEILWSFYVSDSEHTADVALLLSILSGIDDDYADAGVDKISHGLSFKKGKFDYTIGKLSCVVIQNMTPRQDNQLVSRLFELLLIPAPTMEWFGFAHEAVHAIAHLAPLDVLVQLLNRFRQNVSKIDDAEEDEAPEKLKTERQTLFFQMIYVAGEVILQACAYLDKAKARFLSNLQNSAFNQESKLKDQGKDELAVVVQGANSVHLQFEEIHREVKQAILGNNGSIFALFAPMVTQVSFDIASSFYQVANADTTISGADRYSPLAQIAAISTLSKFMCADKGYCSDNINLLCELLEYSQSEEVKSTLVIAMGDLNTLHSHEMEDYTHMLFSSLNDSSQTVQRTTVVVITFLILGGKVKVRGNLGNMALLLHDDDPKINSLAHTFFNEFAQRDKDLYNSFIEILGIIERSQTATKENKKAVAIINTLCGLLTRKADTDRTLSKLEDKLRRCDSGKSFAIYKQAAEKLIKQQQQENRGDNKRNGVSQYAELEKLIERGYYENDQDDSQYVEEANDSDVGAHSPKRVRKSLRAAKVNDMYDVEK